MTNAICNPENRSVIRATVRAGAARPGAQPIVPPRRKRLAGLGFDTRQLAEGRSIRSTMPLGLASQDLAVPARDAVKPEIMFRVVFVGTFHRACYRVNDGALRFHNAQLLKDPVIVAIPGARHYSTATLRRWVSRFERELLAAKICEAYISQHVNRKGLA